MDTNGILALAGVIGAIIIVVIQQMYPTIPKYVGWPIIGALLIGSTIIVGPKYFGVWEWPIIGIIAIGMIFSFVYYWSKRKINVASINNPIAITESKTDEQSHSRKLEARALHKKIMELDSDLERKKNELTEKEDWKENPDIRQILDKLQTTLNDLGYLVNNRDYDRWVEDVMSLHSKKLYFHMKESESIFDEWSRARINAKLRDFVKKVKE